MSTAYLWGITTICYKMSIQFCCRSSTQMKDNATSTIPHIRIGYQVIDRTIQYYFSTNVYIKRTSYYVMDRRSLFHSKRATLNPYSTSRTKIFDCHLIYGLFAILFTIFYSFIINLTTIFHRNVCITSSINSRHATIIF